MKQVLREFITQHDSKSIMESIEDYDRTGNSTGKSLYVSGICIQGGIKNANGRVYPVNEIGMAVNTLNDQIKNGYSVCGEADHPDDLKINIDRISHEIKHMWMEGPNGYGKLRILPTDMGRLIKTLLESGIKLGVSSRGSGNVNENGSGEVSDFEIITIDFVMTPSAPGSYPTPIYEHLMNTKGGYKSIILANEAQEDAKLQKYLKESMLNIIGQLK